MPLHYIYLIIAVSAEVIGTTALQASQQFTKPLPSVLVVLGYGTAFYFLSLTLKFMPVGVVYALWSGLGVLLISLIGYFVFRQTLDFAAILGLALIVSGIVVINLFSKTAGH